MFVIAYRYGVAVVIRRSEQVPDNRLRSHKKVCDSPDNLAWFIYFFV